MREFIERTTKTIREALVASLKMMGIFVVVGTIWGVTSFYFMIFISDNTDNIILFKMLLYATFLSLPVALYFAFKKINIWGDTK